MRGRPLLLTLLALAAAFVLQAGPAAAADAPLAGVHAHLLWPQVDDEERRAQLAQLKLASADIVRVDVGWSTLEPTVKGQYEPWYLRRLDLLVDEADAAGIDLLLEVTDSPCWASSAPDSLKQGCEGAWWERGVQRYAPTDPDDYADAMEFLVRRYGQRVRAWEIANEPNLSHYFTADDPARRYTQMVIAAYDRVKQVDPRTFVVAGAVASADTDFVQDLIDEGIAGHFDAFSVHPYSEDHSPLDPFPDQWVKSSFIRGVPRVRKVLTDAGVNSPIWLTEFGWSTCRLRAMPEAWQNCVDESAQAEFIGSAFRQMREWDYVQAGFYYKLSDDVPPGDDRDANYGLIRHDGTRKPAFAAFQRASELTPTTSLPSLPGAAADAVQIPPTNAGPDLSVAAPTVRAMWVTKRRLSRRALHVRTTRAATLSLRLEHQACNRGRCAWEGRGADHLAASVRVTTKRLTRMFPRTSFEPGRWRIIARTGTGQLSAVTFRV